MGTSNSYSGPGHQSPLLPPWADTGDWESLFNPLESPAVGPSDFSDSGNGDEHHLDQQEPPGDRLDHLQQPQAVDLSHARRFMTQYVSGGGVGNLGKSIRSYVGGMGGSRSAAGSARSGKTATRNIGRFFSNVATRGAAQTFVDVGLAHLVGQPLDIVLAEITDILIPQGTSLDDEVAKQAVNATVEEIYKKFYLTGDGVTDLDSMSVEDVRVVIEQSVTNYIYHRFLLVLLERLERQEVNPNQLAQIEKEIADFIEAKVELDLSDVDVIRLDWDGIEGKTIVDQIYEQAYSFLEAVS